MLEPYHLLNVNSQYQKPGQKIKHLLSLLEMWMLGNLSDNFKTPAHLKFCWLSHLNIS